MNETVFIFKESMITLMKRLVQLFAAILFSAVLFAQTGKVSLSGKLSQEDKVPVILIQNIDSIKIPVSIGASNVFSVVKNDVPKGFYEVDKIGTIYFSPGYNLTVRPAKDGGYFFTGTGALENNALQDSKKQKPALLKLNTSGELDSLAYFTDVPVFLQKLDSFQHNGEILFSKSTDTFFQKYAKLDLEFNSRRSLYLYFAFYGIDRAKMMSMSDSLRKLDPKSPDFSTKVLSFNRSIHIKEMNANDRQKLNNLLFTKWDKNDEILFRNSGYYREAFTNFFTSMVYNIKYLKAPKLEDLKVALRDLKREDADIKKLAIVKGEIANPYILSYFNHSITSSILKITKDTVTRNKFYNDFLASETRKDYVEDIKETYQNLTAFTASKPAPAFIFKDVSGKPVSLESFRGRYIYIDVWATWCEPCKAELPHLKEVEEAYHDKNIGFVSISVDEPGNIDRWKSFVKKNNLMGTQLITDNAFETLFIKKMSINSIPRFILIDPAGKLVYADALRPSDKELRGQLDKLLL